MKKSNLKYGITGVTAGVIGYFIGIHAMKYKTWQMIAKVLTDKELEQDLFGTNKEED